MNSITRFIQHWRDSILTERKQVAFAELRRMLARKFSGARWAHRNVISTD